MGTAGSGRLHIAHQPLVHVYNASAVERSEATAGLLHCIIAISPNCTLGNRADETDDSQMSKKWSLIDGP